MRDNFFESHVLAKRAMKSNLFTEVYVSAAVTTPIQLKGWVNQANPYERHGQRWHLYISRVRSCDGWRQSGSWPGLARLNAVRSSGRRLTSRSDSEAGPSIGPEASRDK